MVGLICFLCIYMTCPIISLLQFFFPRVIFLVHLESILMKNNCDLNFSLQIYIGCYLKQRHCLIDLKPCFGCWNLEEECLLGCMLSHKSLDSSAQSNSPPNILWTHVLILLPLSPVFIYHLKTHLLSAKLGFCLF